MTTNRDRLRKWREKKLSQGGRSLSVWLDPDVARKVDALKQHYGGQRRGENRTLVARAIESLYDSVFKPPAGDAVS